MALSGARFLLDLFSVLETLGDGTGGPVAHLTLDERFASGTGDRQADGRRFEVRTLGASAGETLNLQTDLDEFGNALAAAEVVVFVLRAHASNVGNLRVTPGAVEPWNDLLGATGQHDLRPGAALVLFSTADGDYPITAGNRQLDVDNLDGGNPASYTLYALVRQS